MRVQFIKGVPAARSDQLVCLRDDGSRTTGEMPRQGILPHDAFHFVVESTLGWGDAFFGQVARGRSLDPLADKTAGTKTDWAKWPRALQAESLVECLQAEQWGGASDVATFAATLAVTCRQRGVRAPALGAADLARIRTALRDFGAAWRPLPPGGILERAWEVV